MDAGRAQLRDHQGCQGGLGKGAQGEAGVTFSHPHSSHTTKGPAGAQGEGAVCGQLTHTTHSGGFGLQAYSGTFPSSSPAAGSSFLSRIQ